MSNLSTNAACNQIAEALTNANPGLNTNGALNLVAQIIQDAGSSNNNWTAVTDPTSSDWDGYVKGSYWFNLLNNNLYIAVDVVPIAEEATWLLVNNQPLPYGVYTALLTQTGTNAPTILVLQTTLNTTPVASYVSPGVYRLTDNTSFAYNVATPSTLDKNGNNVFVRKTASGVVTITALLDGLLQNTLIDLKIYNA